MMKYKLYILGFICLVITFFVIKGTYALFETDASGEADFQVGKWVIKLNDRDISLNKLITLDDFVYTSSEHTEEGYFAPGSSAEFEIDMDVSESDVSVEYEIEIDDSSLDDYPNINFKIYDLSTNEEMLTNTTSGVITLDDPVKTKSFKLVLVWEDIEDYDESDTSLIGETLRFNARVNFKQYTGE